MPPPARPLTKTSATTLRITPELRDLWEQCSAAEHRTLTNLFEVAVRDYAKRLGITSKLSTAPKAGLKKKSP
jgi:hypothetical protein